jgi:glycerol kinase
VGTKPVISKYGLLATVAYDFGKGRKPVYALEGSIAVAGSGVQFLKNNLNFFESSSKITEVAETVKDNGGVVFVTAFSGLFAPYWIDDAKGTLCEPSSFISNYVSANFMRSWHYPTHTERTHCARHT